MIPGLTLRRRGRHKFDESITLPRRRFNVARARSLVAKYRSEPTDDDVDTVIKTDVPVWPQPALDLFTRDQLTRPLEQQTEQIDRLSAEPYGAHSSLQLPSPIVKREVSERLHHGRILGACLRLYMQ
jgi:hypothetical protein